MKKTTRIVFAAMLGLASMQGQEATAVESASDTSTGIIESLVAKRFADLGFKKGDFEVRKSPEIEGIYEITVKDSLVYFTDENVRYFIIGHILDPVSRTDITLSRLNASRVEPLREAVKKGDLFAVGNMESKNEIVIFDDPDCPYCARLESSLDANSDIKAYHVMSPLTQLHPEARDHATSVLCSNEKGAVLKRIMQMHSQHKPIPAATEACARKAAPLWETHDALTKKYGINGTPFLVRLTDGAVWQGYMPVSILQRWAAGENVSPAEVNAAMQAGL